MKNIQELEKKIDKLDNLFSVNSIINQAIDFEDFIQKFTDFMKIQAPDLKFIFAAYDKKLFRYFSQSKYIKSDEYFECDFDNISLWNTLNKNTIIKVKDNDHNLFSSFLKEAGFKENNVEYIRGFFNKDMPVCFCFVLNENNKETDNEQIEKFSYFLKYIEPKILKYIVAKNQ